MEKIEIEILFIHINIDIESQCHLAIVVDNKLCNLHQHLAAFSFAIMYKNISS